MAVLQPPSTPGGFPLQLREGIEIQASGREWTVCDVEGRIYRVSPDIAALLGSLDGQLSQADLPDLLTQRTGRQWTAAAIDQALASVSAKGFIENGQEEPPKRKRIRFVPPLTLQVGFFNPTPFLDRIRKPLQVLISTPLVMTYISVILLGLIILVVQREDAWTYLSTPLPIATYLAVIVAMMLSTMLHEMGHGATLTAFGGKPRQIGFMLFYLTPAFFCDVSDGWRLDSKWKRVYIALAGIITQGTLAGIASILTVIVDDPQIRTGLLLYAVMGYISGLVNLIPFVKLDGYIALMSYLDISHLRDKAIRDARRGFSKILFGHASQDELPSRKTYKIYGLICMVFPAYLIFLALALWLDVIARFAGWGTILACIVILLITVRLAIGYINIAKEAWSHPRFRLRVTSVTAITTAIIAISALYVELPMTVEAGFVNDDQGPAIVFDGSTSIPSLNAGDTVQVRTSGLIGSQTVGTLTVIDGVPTERVVPIDTIAPIIWDGAELRATAIPLTPPNDVELPTSGTVLLQFESKNLYEWVTNKYIEPVFNMVR